jgi:hypothetical protein
MSRMSRSSHFRRIFGFWVLCLCVNVMSPQKSPQNTLACLPPSRRCAKHPPQYYEFATNACGMWGRRRRRHRCAFSFLLIESTIHA